MNPDTGLKFSDIFRCAWRGGLAAMIGPLCFILFMAAKSPNDALAIAYLPIILPITAAVGGIIGVIIGLLHFAGGLRVRRLLGGAIGAAFSTCLLMLAVYLFFGGNESHEFSWFTFSERSIILGLIVGALPGLFSVPKKAVKKGISQRLQVNKV